MKYSNILERIAAGTATDADADRVFALLCAAQQLASQQLRPFSPATVRVVRTIAALLGHNGDRHA